MCLKWVNNEYNRGSPLHIMEMRIDMRNPVEKRFPYGGAASSAWRIHHRIDNCSRLEKWLQCNWNWFCMSTKNDNALSLNHSSGVCTSWRRQEKQEIRKACCLEMESGKNHFSILGIRLTRLRSTWKSYARRGLIPQVFLKNINIFHFPCVSCSIRADALQHALLQGIRRKKQQRSGAQKASG